MKQFQRNSHRKQLYVTGILCDKNINSISQEDIGINKLNECKVNINFFDENSRILFQNAFIEFFKNS